jgi:hypothetical protein
MPEWWTYGLSDFLMFSPRVYYRMIERYNTALWPGQLAALVAGALLFRLPRRPEWRLPVLATILAAAWAWVAWGFFWERYAAIGSAGRYFAALGAAEAVLLGLAAAAGGRPAMTGRTTGEASAGTALLVLGIVLYPALGPLFGRGWGGAELFGLVPEPTAIATLGALLPADVPLRRVLLVIPLLWCAIGGLTLQAMGSPEAWVCALALLLVGAAHLARRRQAG